MSGVLAAILSTALGGTAIVATRFLAGAADPITIGILRFGAARCCFSRSLSSKASVGRGNATGLLGLASACSFSSSCGATQRPQAKAPHHVLCRA